MDGSELITHISDTSLWIAGYRAQETERADAVFKDPLARKLAGRKGMDMVAVTPNTRAMAFAMVIRTAAIDRLVMSAVARGVDTVINLGAGLDTRPYRMQLPQTLQWMEVDFPHLIAYKNEQLQAEKPVCKLQRIAADLSIREQRLQLFTQLDAAAQKALIITEGVVAYLTNDQAAQLSADLYSMPSFQYWILDYTQGKYRMNRERESLQKMVKTTPFQFDAENPLAFFGKQGWRVVEDLHLLDEARRIGRSMPFSFPWSILIKFSPGLRRIANNTYGYVLFGKT
jgi:methyltransferase (TIGR00027 family)